MSESNVFSRNLIIITVFAGILFQFAILCFTDFNWLLLNAIPDDSFYYFETARNIIHGCGSSFDCIFLILHSCKRYNGNLYRKELY